MIGFIIGAFVGWLIGAIMALAALRLQYGQTIAGLRELLAMREKEDKDTRATLARVSSEVARLAKTLAGPR